MLFSITNEIASAKSSTYKNSLNGAPVIQTSKDFIIFNFCFMQPQIKPGIT